ncbi:MAG: desulfoferrodoxin, partial [Crenarchaeota archaeon]|nr:desulfoferrodoxin [Thermoproteota archaeon]
GPLVCCGKPMKLMLENTDDKAALEKHVPVVEKKDDGYLVKVGAVAHPMIPEHYIEWIEIVTEDRSYRKFLKPGEAPEAFFKIDDKKFVIREYCNLHGLWKNEQK